jgi:hypothetical protein
MTQRSTPLLPPQVSHPSTAPYHSSKAALCLGGVHPSVAIVNRTHLGGLAVCPSYISGVTGHLTQFGYPDTAMLCHISAW